MVKIRETSPLRFHAGGTLLQLSGRYPTLLDVVSELVQNAIDENATRIWITDNRRKRILTVCDNGDGKSKKQFEEALGSVGFSLKLKKPGKIGRFGLGLISPAGKCERYTFISTTEDNPRGYVEWEFIIDNLLSQQQVEGIPMRRRSDLVYGPRIAPKQGEVAVDWRTQLRMEGYDKDSIVSRLGMDALKERILEHYGPTMRRLGTVVSIRVKDGDNQEFCQDIKAEPFSGKKLEEVTLRDPDAGDTIFRFYLAKRTEKGRRGKVLVGELNDEYRLGFSTFVNSVRDLLPEEVASILASGFFEGEILTSKAKLLSNRKGFVEDDRLLGFCAAIEEWYRKYGEALFKEAKEEREGVRYQDLCRRSLRVLEGMFKRPEFQSLLEAVHSFALGTIGVGHARPDKGRVAGVQEITAIALDGGRVSVPQRDEGTYEGLGGAQEPQRDKPQHIPFTAFGPRGQRRVLVRSDSLGLHFSPEAMEGSDKAWELDDHTGILRFNTRHPRWVECETDDRILMRYMEFVAILALVHHRLRELSGSEFVSLAFDELLPPYCYTILNSDKLHRLIVNKKKR